jgi:DNA-binding IclR family transcriptional regulator
MDREMQEHGAGRRRIQSVSVGFRLVRALEAAGEPLTLTQVAAAAEMQTSNAHLYLASYVHEGLVRQDPKTSRYELGPYALQLGIAALRRLDVVALAREELQRLTQQTGEAAHFSIWSNRGPCIVASEDGRRQLPVTSRLGFVLPLLSTATGRIFLAHLPRTDTLRLLQEEQAQSLISDTEVEALIDSIREGRVAYTENMLNIGLAALAVPVIDFAEKLQGALTIIGPSTAIPMDLSSQPARALSNSAEAICTRLGKLVR